MVQERIVLMTYMNKKIRKFGYAGTQGMIKLGVRRHGKDGRNKFE